MAVFRECEEAAAAAAAAQEHTHTSTHTRSHRYEEDAAQQCAGQSRFDDLCVALVSCAMTLQQSCDVEGHLRNRAERGVYYRSHCKVTLCRNTTGKNTMVFTHQLICLFNNLLEIIISKTK